MGPRVHLNVTTGSPSSLQVLNRWWFPLAHGRADLVRASSLTLEIVFCWDEVKQLLIFCKSTRRLY